MSEEKSWFLRLALQAQPEEVVGRDRLEEAEAEVRRLREELGASEKAHAEHRQSLLNAIGGIKSTQQQLVSQRARDRSQMESLTSQVAGLKAPMAAQEAERSAADASREEAEQGRQRLEAECRDLRSACASKFLIAFLKLRIAGRV